MSTLYFFVLLGIVAGQQGAPPTCETFCFGLPVCQHNGFYDDSDTDADPEPCPTDLLLFPEDFVEDVWFPFSICTCTDGFSGIDCSIIELTSSGICKDFNLLYDNEFFNENGEDKYMQCTVDFDPLGLGSIGAVFLYDHHVDWHLNALDGTISIDMRGRFENPDEAIAEETSIHLTDFLSFINCDLQNCDFDTSSGGLDVSCPNKTCISQFPVADGIPNLVQNGITDTFTNDGVPFAFEMDHIKSGHARLHMELSVAGLPFAFDMDCSTGQCNRLPNPDADLVNPGGGGQGGDTVEKPAVFSKFAAMAFWIVCPLILVILFICACFASMTIRSSVGEFEKDGKTPLLVQVATNLESLPLKDLQLLKDHKKFNTKDRGPPVLVFADLSYFAPQKLCRTLQPKRDGWEKKEREKVLCDMMGMSCRGELTALIGPSGAGKTTLFDILSGTPKGGIIRGEIRTAGKVTYLHQDEAMVKTETIEQTLNFAAKMRLPRHTTDEERRQKVAGVMHVLNIEKIAGRKLSRVSGGESRRVAIGCHVVGASSVLLLDEPTSGLDSTSAASVVNLLKGLTRTHEMSIMVIIHQPTKQMFDMFDQVMFMTSEGELAYYGPPQTAVERFERIWEKEHDDAKENFEHGEDLQRNPAEFFVDLMSGHHPQQLQKFITSFEKSENHRSLSQVVRSSIRSSMSSKMDGEENVYPVLTDPNDVSQDAAAGGNGAASQPISSVSKLAMLCARSFRRILKDRTFMLVRVLIPLCVAIGQGFVFFNLDNNIAGAQNRVGLFFFLCMFFSLEALVSIGTFIEERKLFQQEQLAGDYGAVIYLLSKLVAEIIPIRILAALVYAAPVYYLTGLRSGFFEFFTPFVFILVLYSLVSSAAALAISSLAKNSEQATLAGVMFFVFSLLFGGLFVSAATEGGLAQLRVISYTHYAFEPLMINEFKALPVVLDAEAFGVASFDAVGDVYLAQFGLKAARFNSDIYTLCGFFGGFLLVALFGLRYLHRKVR